MSSIDDPSKLNKIYVIPSTVKYYPRNVKMDIPNKGLIILAPTLVPVAPLKTEHLKSIDYSNIPDSERKKTTVDMSQVRLFRDPPTKPSDNGKKLIPHSNNQNEEMELKTATSENVSTEVVWLPPASQKGKKSLVLENENIEMLHSENETDENSFSVSDQSDSENELLNSSRDTQHGYNSNKTTPEKTNQQDLNRRSEKLNHSDKKITFNPKDILKQLKVINSTKIPKQGDNESVSRRQYCGEWLKHQALSGFEQDQKLFNFLTSKLKPSRALESRVYLKSLVSSLSYELSHMWTESGKNKDTFYKEYSDWLNGPTIRLAAINAPTIRPAASNAPDKLVRIHIETNADAFKFLKNLEQPFKADGLIKLIPCTDLTPDQKANLRDFCNRYVADMKFKWLTSNNNEGVFFKKFECWLKLIIKWPVFLKDVLPTPKKTDTETVSNEELNIASDITEEQVMKLILNSNIETIEKILASKCSETGKDISKLIHRVIHHPEDAALIAGAITAERECNCYPKHASKSIPDKNKIFKPPSQAQKEVLKKTVERLKDSMPTPSDPINVDATESPFHKKHAATAEAHQSMMNRILSKLKIDNPPVRKEANRADIISKASVNPIVIHDEDDEVDTIYETNKGGDKIVKGVVFKYKVGSAKSSNQLKQQKFDDNTVISTSKDSLYNCNEEMIVDTPIHDDNDNTIDLDDNFETLEDQTNEENHQNLEFGPVLDKLIFIQPLNNVPHGTIIRLPENKEATICKVSNCSATVLVPKFIKKSGPNVRVRKSNYEIKRVPMDKKNTASSKISTVMQTYSNKNHGTLQDSQKRQEQKSLVQMQNASRKLSVLGNAKRKEESIANVKFKPPSKAQKEVLKMTVEKLRNIMPKHASKQAMQNQFLSRFNFGNPYQANEGGDKIVKGVVFKFKVKPAKSNKQLNQPTLSDNTVISTAEESLHNCNEEMIVDTPIHDDNDNTIDLVDNFETPTEQTNENNHDEALQFVPVLNKLTNRWIIKKRTTK